MTRLAATISQPWIPALALARRDSSPEAVSWDRPRHYAVGVVPVTLQSAHRPTLRAFHALYADHALRTGLPNAVEVEVRRTRRGRSLRRRYEVWAGGARRFTVWQAHAVLPHVEWAINWQIMLDLPRFYQVHAGVIEIDAEGVIFPASPGSGKTTLTAGMLARGARYLSDEFALIDPQTLRLHPYPKALCVKEGSFDALRRLGIPMADRPVYGKGKKGRVVLVRPDEFRPNAVGGECPVRHIVFCHYRPDAGPSIRPVTRADATLRLIRQSFTFAKFRALGVELLVNVVRRAECYELICGPVDETCELVLRTVGHR